MTHMFSTTRHQLTGAIAMCLEKYVRNFGFALAALAIIVGIGYTLEYQPVIYALAR
jgi:hypothetical protein